jgi:hypothetical protein
MQHDAKDVQAHLKLRYFDPVVHWCALHAHVCARSLQAMHEVLGLLWRTLACDRRRHGRLTNDVCCVALLVDSTQDSGELARIAAAVVAAAVVHAAAATAAAAASADAVVLLLL